MKLRKMENNFYIHINFDELCPKKHSNFKKVTFKNLPTIKNPLFPEK